MEKHGFADVWVNGGSGIVENYNAGGVNPIPTVTFNGNPLTLGKDYTLKYLNNKKVASSTDSNPPTIQIKFKGNYSGILAKNFTIMKQAITASNIHVDIPNVIYNSKAGSYASKIVLKDVAGKALTKNKDYTIKYYSDSSYTQLFTDADNAAGVTVYALVEGCGENYHGARRLSYKIYKGDLSKATVKVADKEYQNGKTLISKSDITITYNGNAIPASELRFWW